tara:strand:- start:6134 stop:7426 length:1293 start_codon:yes stop_codon:yes gene_type:complete
MSNINDILNSLTVKPKFIHNDFSDFKPGKTPVFYSGPYWDDDEVHMALKAFLTGKWLSSGENVSRFEKKFVKKFNTDYGLMVNSGSSANLVMIGAIKKVLNWNDGDEIIVSPVGFPTTIAPIVQHNLVPVFIDIEFDTLNFDINLIEEKITDKTKAIFLSPVLGNPPDMDLLVKLCEKYNLELILDGCDSLGTKWKDKLLVEYSIAWSNSFYPSHHITTGEGGMVCSDNQEIVSTARSMAWWGRDCYCIGAGNLLPNGSCGNRFDNWLPNYDGVMDHKYIFTNLGYNLKPLDFQGAIGLAQMGKVDEIHEKRRNAKYKLERIFENNLNVKIPRELKYAETSWFGTPIVCENKEYKTKLVNHLEKHKIQTRNYFAGNILMHPGYSNLDRWGDYPLSNEVLNKVIFIGAAPHYNDKVFNYIEEIVEMFSEDE